MNTARSIQNNNNTGLTNTTAQQSTSPGKTSHVVPSVDVTFRDAVGYQHTMTSENLGELVSTNPRLAFLALRDLKNNKGQKDKNLENRIGFSRKHEGKVETLLEKFETQGFQTSYKLSEIEDACTIAKNYREQLWFLCEGIANQTKPPISKPSGTMQKVTLSSSEGSNERNFPLENSIPTITPANSIPEPEGIIVESGVIIRNWTIKK